MDAAAELSSNSRREKILSGYLRGQLAKTTSLALYYSLFSPVASVLGGSYGLGGGRSGYALAQALCSPIAGVLAERWPARSILVGAFAARALIWAGMVPTAFCALGRGPAFVGVFIALMFLDGAVVSLNGIVDIDEGGIDLLARQHGFPVDDALRNRFNAVMDAFSSAGRVLLAPLVALLALYAAGVLRSAGGGLIAAMALSILVPAAVGIRQYLAHIPHSAASGGAGWGPVFSELASGFSLAWTNSQVRWRFALNSLERAVEDSMLFVMLAEFCMRVLSPENKALGAVYTVCLIALGKVGAILSARAMQRRWRAPLPGEAKFPRYKIFFPLAFSATLATGLLPLAYLLASAGRRAAAVALACAGAFLFNLLFTASKLGFRNLMQGIVSEMGASGRLFGIQATVEMGVNALVIMGLSLLFASASLPRAFAGTAALYVAFGLFDLLAAPRLLFTPAERSES